MKLRLKIQQQIPYGGLFIVNRPDLGVVGRGLQFSNLVMSARDWRRANGWPAGVGFEEEVEQAACLTYPAECESGDGTMLRPRNLQLSDIVTGTKTMLRFKLAGSPLVAPEEANLRAAICSNCPYNVKFSKPCTGICAELKNLVSDIINHHGTPSDSNLNSCQICGCFLQAAVWLPNEITIPPLSGDQRLQFNSVPNCWKKLDSNPTNT